MKKLNNGIKAIGLEHIAQSQIILSTDKMITEDKCVVVFVGNDNIEIAPKLADIQSVYKFNAFDKVEDSYAAIDNLFRKLKEEDVDKINELLK
jgi:hypothetical protein